MSMMKEFKDFAIKGNAVDMAVGLVIGAAFGKIISTLVSKVIMPPVGLLMGGVDFSSLKHILQAAEGDVAEVAISYGEFFNVMIDFVIIAFSIFMVVRMINKLKKAPAPADPTEKECSHCLSKVPIKATKCMHCTSSL